MVRSLYSLLGLAAFGAAFTLAPVARAETIALSGDCSYQTNFGCSAECTPGSINCSVQYVDQCSSSCTATASTSCTTACETECKTNPGSFTCSGYCGDQCMTECTKNNFDGAGTLEECVTDCQGQCSYQCNLNPPTTVCSTECGTSCQAVENIQCSVKCQVKDSASCNITPASCMAACNGTGGAIICNGQVVYIAANVEDAAAWYVSHLDAQFSLMANVNCTGNTCTGSISAGGCAASPAGKPAGAGLLLAGLAFVGVGVARRRRQRRG